MHFTYFLFLLTSLILSSNCNNSTIYKTKYNEPLERRDVPLTYRLHSDLLKYYKKGTRPVIHPNKIISVTMSVFLYQIIKLDAVKNTISLSGSFEMVSKIY
ncbi:Neurotransmitter-gated ion-channel ligand binding domain family protein [Brugia pahangi]